MQIRLQLKKYSIMLQVVCVEFISVCIMKVRVFMKERYMEVHMKNKGAIGSTGGRINL